MNKADNQLLIIFGASGDLTARKLLPALFELHIKNMLPTNFAILGAARTEFTDEEYRASTEIHLREALKDRVADEAQIQSFLQLVYYVAFDSTQSEEYTKLKAKVRQLQDLKQLGDRVLY